MMWEITKTFEACYGHRVWNQILNKDYSLDTCLVCRHLHGHQASIQVILQGENLIDGMITDFKNLNWLKKFIDEVIDHKFIMDLNDPLLEYEAPLVQEIIISGKELLFFQERYWIIPPETYSSLPKVLKEKYEGMVFVDFVPTSENLAKWIFDIVDEKMSRINVKTKSVVFYETPKSRSEYIGY